MPPNTDAPMQDEPMTECGSRPSGAAAVLSSNSVAPGRQITWPSLVDQLDLAMRSVLTMTISAIIVVAIRRRSAGQAGIGRLHDDDLAGGDAGQQNLPLLDERAGPYHGQRRSVAEPESRAVATRAGVAGQDMFRPDDRPQAIEKWPVIARGRRRPRDRSDHILRHRAAPS